MSQKTHKGELEQDASYRRKTMRYEEAVRLYADEITKKFDELERSILLQF